MANISSAVNLARAIFLDRDGVLSRSLIRDGKPFAPTELNDFEILPESPKACQRLKRAGFLLIVVTNQPEVGRGTLRKETVEAMHAKLFRELPIDRIEVCYHPGHGASDCDCRKPKPGSLFKAAREFGIDLTRSWIVGDRWRDIDCGHAAGCRTIFIDRGYAESLKQAPDFRVRDLAEAADVILSEARAQ
ncbi:MAG TPA: HAD family hydrolase [Candidatus Angelobacter sp.]|nr:HAD family hydrolase [Candidatus Angelobacter sp.]